MSANCGRPSKTSFSVECASKDATCPSSPAPLSASRELRRKSPHELVLLDRYWRRNGDLRWKERPTILIKKDAGCSDDQPRESGPAKSVTSRKRNKGDLVFPSSRNIDLFDFDLKFIQGNLLFFPCL